MITSRTQQELEREINIAFARGATRELERLRAEYRRVATVTAAGRGYRLEPARVIDRPRRYGGSGDVGVIDRPVPYEASPTRRHALETEDDRPLVILNKAIFEKLRDVRFGREDGFWLVGRDEQEARAVEVHRAMWPAMDHDRESHSLVVDFTEADQLNAALDYGHRVVGHAHSQPNSSWPSEQDFTLWARALDYFKPPFVGVVVAERIRGPVDVRAFTVSRENGSVVHKAAHIHWRGI